MFPPGPAVPGPLGVRARGFEHHSTPHRGPPEPAGEAGAPGPQHRQRAPQTGEFCMEWFFSRIFLCSYKAFRHVETLFVQDRNLVPWTNKVSTCQKTLYGIVFLSYFFLFLSNKVHRN